MTLIRNKLRHWTQFKWEILSLGALSYVKSEPKLWRDKKLSFHERFFLCAENNYKLNDEKCPTRKSKQDMPSK